MLQTSSLFFFLKAYAEIPCVKQVNSSLRKQSLISQNVSPCVCPSTQGLEELAERIFLKFCMKLDDVVNRRTTEPDFRFSISFRTYCPKSVENGRFSRFLAIFSKTAPTFLIIFWYVVDLIVGYHPTVVTCLAKIFFGSYSVRKLSEKVSSVRGHFLRWFVSYFKKANIF